MPFTVAFGTGGSCSFVLIASTNDTYAAVDGSVPSPRFGGSPIHLGYREARRAGVQQVAAPLLEPAYRRSQASSQAAREQELDQQVLQYCGMTRDGVTTYRGLTGTYVRLGLTAIDEPLRLALVATHDDPDAKGTFTGTYASATGSSAYAGNFGAIPDNPAIGAAFMLDTNGDHEYDKLYFVLAIRRSFGLVQGLCLEGANHPFLMARSYF